MRVKRRDPMIVMEVVIRPRLWKAIPSRRLTAGGEVCADAACQGFVSRRGFQAGPNQASLARRRLRSRRMVDGRPGDV